jgi:hypothetical protein
MSQSEKAAYYNAVKAAGVPLTKHYREYNTEELKEAYGRLAEVGAAPPLNLEPRPDVRQVERTQAPVAPVAPRNPNEMPGQRLNTHDELTPLRTDPETGFIWYQEEVRKPAAPKPRGRRVLKYDDPGVKKVEVVSGEYPETIEVGGDRLVPSEAKITLPSYQVGIYVDPRFPRFKVHTYNGVSGFNLFDVERYYGGAELVPAECQRMYVSNDLCYDIRSVVRAINTEFRQLQLAGKI